MLEGAGFRQNAGGLIKAEAAHQRIQKSRARREEHDDHAGQHHGGNEVRRVGNYLQRDLHPLGTNLIKQQRQQDRSGNLHQQTVEEHGQRIAQHPFKIEGIDEALQMLQPHEGRGLHGHGRRIVLERNLQAVHGHVGKHHEKRDDGDQQQVQIVIPFQYAPPFSSFPKQKTADSARIFFHCPIPPFVKTVRMFFSLLASSFKPGPRKVNVSTSYQVVGRRNEIKIFVYNPLFFIYNGI